MEIHKQISLKPFNTFGINVLGERMVVLTSNSQLPEIANMGANRLVLGGGSNVLFTKDVSGLIILNKLQGISIEKENDDYAWLRVHGGEWWHNVVLFAIDKNLGGIENLALIPGTAGASPIQNIGAYGVEVKETIEEVVCWHWEDQNFRTLKNEDCCFGYRDSIFKHSLKGQVLVTSILFKLNKYPQLRTSYGAINTELEIMNLEPSVKNIALAVINIRRSKLPDPAIIGNAGSFFKNPEIALVDYEALRGGYPGMPSYPITATRVKIPAGWLIEQCGLKGYRKGDAGVHTKQALVLVNYGSATGSGILQLSAMVIEAVQDRFGIVLEREVQIL